MMGRDAICTASLSRGLLGREGNAFAVLGVLPLTGWATVVSNPSHKSSVWARVHIFATQQIDRGPQTGVNPVLTYCYGAPLRRGHTDKTNVREGIFRTRRRLLKGFSKKGWGKFIS